MNFYIKKIDNIECTDVTTIFIKNIKNVFNINLLDVNICIEVENVDKCYEIYNECLEKCFKDVEIVIFQESYYILFKNVFKNKYNFSIY